jgi:hypothetical protein
MNMHKSVLVAFGLAMLSGCGSAPEPVKPLAPAYVPPKPPVAPKPAAPKPAPPPVMKPVVEDACGAKDMQYLIGKPKTEIPIPLNPALRRVACSTCAVTMDYNPQRQTITFDANTGIVTAVRCG